MTTRPDIPCLDCGVIIVQAARGRTARHCAECRVKRKLAQDAERSAAIRADQDLLRQVAESLRDHLDPSMYVKVDEYVASLGVQVTRDTLPLSHDAMPDGSFSNAGSDDGMSTTYPDLQADLDARRLEVIVHDWFAEHPHWTVGL